jgi:zinc protease
MITLWRRLCLVALAILALASLPFSPPLGAENLDAPLPVDPAVHMGRLDNGVTYWVRSHATPPGKIAFWMHVATGSVNEEDGQEGIAHYLEHMAFNGTQHFPPGELIKYFESIGLRFGQHQNAFTSFNQTTYILTLPNTNPETIDKGLLCLADFAFRMLLTEEEIAKERSVILEENRARKGVGQRLMERLLPSVLPGSRVARRLPIGLEETLKRVQRRDLLAYYTTWYHPAKVTILAVGDAPVETIVAAITKHFAGWQRRGPPPADKDYGITPYTKQHAVVVTDPELTTAGVETLSIRPRTPQRTIADFRRRLVESIGIWIMNRRLQQLIQEGKAPYQSAAVHRSALLEVAEQFSAEAEAEPAAWGKAFKGLLAEIQRARLYGFAPQELADAKKAAIATAELAAQTASTRDAQVFLRDMNRAVTNHEQPRSAAQDLQLLRQLMPGVTREEVDATFAMRFDPDRRAYVLTLPERADLPVPSRKELLTLVNDALAAPVEPWRMAARPSSLLDQKPQAGAIIAQMRFAPLDVTHVTFANNVRLHYRFMDFKKDHVTVAITLAGGKIRERPANRGITNVAVLALSRPATRRYSSTAIRDFMTGKKVWVGGHMTEDALRLDISGTPEALEDGLQLAYLLLQDAKIEPSSVALWKYRKLQALASLRTRIGAQVREAASLVLSGYDPRQALLTPDQVKTRAKAISQAQVWLDAILRSAPMEVAIVGDIPEDRALRLAATYLGSLPQRPRHDPSLTPLRQVAGFTGPLTKTVDVETITPRAHLMLMWRCADWQDVRGRRLIHLVARILERRLRREIREERGLTYSVSVYARPNKIYPKMSALYVEFTTDPDKITEAVHAARSVVETFAAEGPTIEEIETVRAQLKNSIETTLKEPRFWVRLLADLEYHGTHLEDVHGLLDQIMAFSQADIAAEAKKTIVPERFAMVIGRPNAPVPSRESRVHPLPPASTTP